LGEHHIELMLLFYNLNHTFEKLRLLSGLATEVERRVESPTIALDGEIRHFNVCFSENPAIILVEPYVLFHKPRLSGCKSAGRENDKEGKVSDVYQRIALFML